MTEYGESGFRVQEFQVQGSFWVRGFRFKVRSGKPEPRTQNPERTLNPVPLNPEPGSYSSLLSLVTVIG